MRVSFQVTLDGLVRALRGTMLDAVESAESGDPHDERAQRAQPVHNRRASEGGDDERGR